MDFFETSMGHQFFCGTMPRIAKALETIADALAGKEKERLDALETRVAELEKALQKKE